MKQSNNQRVKNRVQKFSYTMVLILFIFLICICVSAFKVEGIHGIVYDGEGNPVPGATVALYASNGEFIDYTLSMDDGSFCFFHVEDGEYFIVATKDKFSTRCEVFRYNRTTGKRLDLILNPSVGVMDLLERKWFFFGPIIGAIVGFFFAFLLEECRNVRKRRNLRKVILSIYDKPFNTFLVEVKAVNAGITGDLVDKTVDKLKMKCRNLKNEISTIIKNYGEGLSALDPKFLIDINKKREAIEDLEKYFSQTASILVDFLKDHHKHRWESEPEAHNNFEELLTRLKPKKSFFDNLIFFHTFFP